MQGFKHFIESYADYAYHIGQDLEGPSPLDAVSDVADYKKIVKLADFLIGASKMILMVKPTLKSNIEVAYDLKDVLRHPKKSKYWAKLAKSVAKSSKLTLANPLMLFPTIMPVISSMPASKQAIILGALKAVSTIYFYITSLADQDIDNAKVREILKKIKPLLPDIYDQNSKQV
jgi:hypothetical protein